MFCFVLKHYNEQDGGSGWRVGERKKREREIIRLKAIPKEKDSAF